MLCLSLIFFFFFNDTATTEIYTLSLHDALPISFPEMLREAGYTTFGTGKWHRSEEHTSELQSLTNLVCRLLLEKKKKKQIDSFRKEQIGSHADIRPIPNTHTHETSQNRNRINPQ